MQIMVLRTLKSISSRFRKKIIIQHDPVKISSYLFISFSLPVTDRILANMPHPLLLLYLLTLFLFLVAFHTILSSTVSPHLFPPSPQRPSLPLIHLLVNPFLLVASEGGRAVTAPTITPAPPLDSAVNVWLVMAPQRCCCGSLVGSLRRRSSLRPPGVGWLRGAPSFLLTSNGLVN